MSAELSGGRMAGTADPFRNSHQHGQRAARPLAVFGFRYDTLAGHIETGSECFLLMQSLGTGAIGFRRIRGEPCAVPSTDPYKKGCPARFVDA